MKMLLALVFFSLTALPLTESLPIPRIKTYRFLSEGSLIGGSHSPANLEDIRFSAHISAGYERWVVDFSDISSRLSGKEAPRFQLRYIKATKVEMPGSVKPTLIPPKLILTVQMVKQNFLEKKKLKQLTKKSRFITDIVIYPHIENGDLAIEFLLGDSIVFDAHQPRERAGRLVIDLKNAPL